MSKLFKSKQSTPQYDVAMDPYASIRQPTLNWLSGQIGKTAPQYTGEMVAPISSMEKQAVNPYAGEFVAPSTAQEKESLDWLKKYVEQGPSEGMGLASEEVRKTMTGQYDPTSSPYYQAVKAESARNLEDVQRNIADQAAGGGRYWSGARLKEQGEAGTEAGLAMNKLLYGMQETERGRRLSTAPFAAQLGQYAEQQPLAKAGALQQYGGLERTLQQAKLEAMYKEWLRTTQETKELGGLERTLQQARNEAIYNEWLRATQEYPMQIGAMGAGLAREPYYVQRIKQPAPITGMLANWFKK